MREQAPLAPLTSLGFLFLPPPHWFLFQYTEKSKKDNIDRKTLTPTCLASFPYSTTLEKKKRASERASPETETKTPNCSYSCSSISLAALAPFFLDKNHCLEPKRFYMSSNTFSFLK